MKDCSLFSISSSKMLNSVNLHMISCINDQVAFVEKPHLKIVILLNLLASSNSQLIRQRFKVYCYIGHFEIFKVYCYIGHFEIFKVYCYIGHFEIT